MLTETEAPAAAPRSRGPAAYLAKILSGPIAFAVVMALPIPLPYEGRVVLATFICVIVWWMTQPMPWAIAAMLPFLVFPAAGVMDIAATMRLYGQPIFFWIMGTVLMGYAIEKHGLAHRFALAFLAIRGVGGRTYRLAFAYMLAVGILSMFVSDAATVAMTIPIGMSIVHHTWTMKGLPPAKGTNFAAFMTLGTFYASVAGGTATMMGVPHNAISVAMLEQFTGRRLGFFEWMSVGVPVFIAVQLAFFVMLWLLLRPEFSDIPSGEAFLRAERARLGGLRRPERRVLLVFAMMVLLFTLPTLVALAFGAAHPFAVVAVRALPVWVVPPAVMFLLFTLRAGDDSGATILTWRDAEQHGPWNSMFLVGGAVAMTDALTQFGFVEFMGGIIKGLGISLGVLPFLAGGVVAVSTNFISGTALYCSVFIPAAAQIGYNPASMAILIANLAVGLIFPWAGATAATAFAAGEIGIGRMIRIGVLATAIFTLVVATIHILLADFI